MKGTDDEWQAYSSTNGNNADVVEFESLSGFSTGKSDFNSIKFLLWEIASNIPFEFGD